jgi:hypothetical protein
MIIQKVKGPCESNTYAEETLFGIGSSRRKASAVLPVN